MLLISLSCSHAVAVLQRQTSINLFFHDPVQSLQYETGWVLRLLSWNTEIRQGWQCNLTAHGAAVPLSELARWGGSECICMNSFGLQHIHELEFLINFWNNANCYDKWLFRTSTSFTFGIESMLILYKLKVLQKHLMYQRQLEFPDRNLLM